LGRSDSHGKQPVAGLVILFIKESKQVSTVHTQFGRLHALLFLVKKGRIQIVIEQVARMLYPGRLLLLPQGRNWFLQQSLSPIEMGIVGLDSKQIHVDTSRALPMSLFKYWERQPRTLDLKTKELHWLLKLFVILKAKIHPTTPSPVHGIVLRYGLHMLLWELDRLIQKEKPVTSIMHTAGHFLVLQFMELLARHYSSQHQVGFYAKRLRVTPDHLSRVIKKNTGRTAKDHIQQLLTQEAKVLLNGPRSIKEIAYLLGFNTAYAFSKFFKRNASVSPTSYRKQHRKSPNDPR
jgi:AraC family transcriptional regulator, transcriptional activator of pobA